MKCQFNTKEGSIGRTEEQKKYITYRKHIEK